MKATISSILIISILTIQGCATSTNIRMSAVASPEQQIGTNETITSQKKHFVSVAPVQFRKQGVGNPPPEMSYKLFVKNCGEKPIDINTDNITVIFKGNIDGTTQRLTIRSFDYLMNEAKRKDMQEANARLGAKGISSRSPSFANIMLDSGGDFPNIREKSIEESVIKPQTIMPGSSAEGLVICETKGLDYRVEGDFRVTVSVDGEEHEFTFKRSPYDKKQ